VIDVDPRHQGDDALHELEQEHGEIAPTWRCLTAGGGVHIYFRHPGSRVGNHVGIWSGIDLRGDGGYVVAPPTELERGRAYTWEIGYGPHEVTLIDPPAWLLEWIYQPEGSPEPRPPDEWAALVRGPILDGARNDTIARLAGHILRCRSSPRVVLELLRSVNESRCRPPLSDEEIIRTVDSIARREAEGRA
jgi:putative DNA primase/helicase